MVNEGVYGRESSWIPISTDSTIKLANFGDDDGTIAKGFSTGKLATDDSFDNSIVHSALGNESAISRMRTFKGGVKLAEDNFSETQWAFVTGKNYFRAVDDTYTDTSTNMLAPITNSYILYSDAIPFTDFSYKNLRAVIGVNARQRKDGGSSISSGLSYYCENQASDYPFVTQIRITLYENKNGTWSPLNVKGNKGLFIFNETSYFSKIRMTGKTFESGLIGSMMCCDYERTADTSAIIIGGVLTQQDDRIYKTDINIVSGDFDVYTDSDRGYFYYDTTNRVQAFREYCWHQTACFGIQFCESGNDVGIDLESEETTQEDAEKIFFGILDGYVGHGDFVRGKAILSEDRYSKDANDNDYDPNTPSVDPNTYYKKSEKPSEVNGNTSFTTKYVMNYGQLNTVANDFYNALNTKPEDLSYQDYSASLFLTNNAIDTIISCKRFPFHVPSTSGQNVKLGNYTIKGSDGQPLVCPTTSKKVVCFEFDCGMCFPTFKDFRDYAPYTIYTLKIPYCSSVQLNTSECVGQPITVTLAVDIETGDCTGFVYADGKLIDSVSGNCAVDVAISGIQQATLDSQIFNASINQRQAKTNTAFAVAKSVINVGANAYGLTKAKKSPMATVQGISHLASSITSSAQDIVNSAYEQKRTGYEISHVQIPFKCVGGVSGGICLSETQNCVLIKESPVMLSEYNEEIYGKTVGFACLINDNLSNFSGLTVCSDIDLSGFTATEREKEMIRNFATGGFKL